MGAFCDAYGFFDPFFSSHFLKRIIKVSRGPATCPRFFLFPLISIEETKHVAVSLFESTTLEAIAWCRRWGIRTLAATPQAARLYTESDMQQAVAIVVGTEQYGLSDAWLTAADEQIKLPMFGTANSLNVAVAATLLLYEAVRQRAG